MKRFFAIVTFVALPLIATAESKSGPSKMSQLDAAKLDAAFMHREIVMQKAFSDSAPFTKEIERICRTYSIDPQQLGKSVGVDPQTGEIQRAPALVPTPEKTK